MVVKKSRKAEAPTHKHVKLKAHHAKPYRKRHVGLLFVSLVSLVIAGLLLVQYRDQIMTGLASSRSFVGGLFAQDKSYDVAIRSSYGFNLSYDQKQFYASAVSGDSGDLYIGGELSDVRAYNIVRIAPNFSSGAASSVVANSAFTLTLHPGGIGQKDSLSTVALQDGGIDPSKVMSTGTETVTVGGRSFQKTLWQSKQSNDLSPALTARFVTYGAIVDGSAVTIAISLGVTGTDESVYAPILETLSFEGKLAFAAPVSNAVLGKVNVSRSLLDMVTNTQVAAAATKKVDLTGSEKVAALYSPAIVKVYNAYCMDISIDGKTYITGACSAGSGSGFFLSQDGYLATNGHVATSRPLDLVITDAISNYANKGNPQYLNYLLGLTTLRPSDIPAGSTARQAIGIMVDALYGLDESRFTATNRVENLLVQVAATNPNVTTLLQNTKDRKEYSTSDKTVVKAKMIASDYRANDGYDGFKASDVAILKVEGENYPVVKLGSIESAVQGSELSILGYPGNASNNGLVDSTSSQATLTTGKVSSVKNAAGSERKLIETDTTIGHGNSGGPALDNDGAVVGLATYTADGSGEGDGVFNYIRDIKDLVDLADAQGISFDTNSATQAAWQSGIAYFYSSYYSKSLKEFQLVKELYPNNSRVDEFIAAAEKRIAAGEDVVDFPIVPLVVVSSIILVGVGLGVLLIVRHHKKHRIYNAGVAQGTVQAAVPGVPPVKTQVVAVQLGGPVYAEPVVTAPIAAAPIATVPPVAVAPVVAAPVAAPIPALEAAPVVDPVTITPPVANPVAEPQPFNPFLTQSETPPQDPQIKP